MICRTKRNPSYCIVLGSRDSIVPVDLLPLSYKLRVSMNLCFSHCSVGIAVVHRILVQIPKCYVIAVIVVTPFCASNNNRIWSISLRFIVAYVGKCM